MKFQQAALNFFALLSLFDGNSVHGAKEVASDQPSKKLRGQGIVDTNPKQQVAPSNNKKRALSTGGRNDFACFGSCTINTPRDGCHQLTPNSGNQVGSLWLWETIDVTNSFTVEATVYLGSNTNGADGLAMVLQAESANFEKYNGGGGNMVYKFIPNAFAVAIDTYSGRSSNDEDYVVVSHTTGTFEYLAKTTLGWNIEDGSEHSLQVEYNAGASAGSNNLFG